MNSNLEIKNKKAGFEYIFLDEEVAGIMLYGSEVKSLREGNANIADAYIQIDENEVWLKKMYIAPYKQGGYANHEPNRDRKILLTKKQVKKWHQEVKTSGVTIIPFKVFFNKEGKVKVEIKLAKGKKTHDKRESIKAKDIKRDLDRNG